MSTEANWTLTSCLDMSCNVNTTFPVRYRSSFNKNCDSKRSLRVWTFGILTSVQAVVDGGSLDQVAAAQRAGDAVVKVLHLAPVAPGLGGGHLCRGRHCSRRGHRRVAMQRCRSGGRHRDTCFGPLPEPQTGCALFMFC